MRVWKREGTLKELAGKDERVSGRITGDELDTIFSLSRYLDNIDYIFKKAGIQ